MSPERRLWPIAWLSAALMALTFLLAWYALPERGCGVDGVWLAEASGRVAAWLQQGAPLAGLEGAWAPHSALPPLTIALVALGRLAGLDYFSAARLLSALSLTLCVPMVWSLGRRAGGPPAAAAAVLALVLTPRALGLATSAGFSGPAMCGLVFAVYALYRARTSALWTLLAPLAVAVGAYTGHAALLALIPWALLTLSDKGQITALLAQGGRDPSAPEGFLHIASFPPRLLLILPLSAAALWLWPWLWRDGAAHLGQYLSHFLRQPHDAVLYLGQRLDGERLPLHASTLLLLATLPPVTAVLGAAGVMGEGVLGALLATRPGKPLRPWFRMRPDPEAAGPEAREAKRWAFGYLGMALLLPWLAGAPRFGPVDLLALALPFWSVFAGCTLSRLFSVTAHAVSQRRAHWPLARVPVSASLALLGVLVFLPSVLVCHKSHPAEESYYSWLIGGPAGALQRGLERNPSAPVPLAVAQALSQQKRLAGGQATMAVLVQSDTWRQVLELYRRERKMDLPTWAPAHEANWLILPHEDEDPMYYEVAPHFARTVPPRSSLVFARRGVRLVTLGTPLSHTQEP